MKSEIVETNDTISWLKDEIPRIQSSLRSIQKYGQNLSNLLNKLEEVKSSRLEKSEIEKAQNSTQTSIQNEQKELDKLEMDLKLLQQSHQMEIDKANKKIESLKENLESKEAENKEISDLIRGKSIVDDLESLIYKVGCAFAVLIWPEFRTGQGYKSIYC